MNRKLLILALIPLLALSVPTNRVSARAEIWSHEVIKDVGKDIVVFEDSTPFNLSVVSTVT